MLKTVGNPSTRYGDQTIIDGNLVIGTSGKGIDFSATPGTGTSELLDDYEEGTFTPTWANLTIGNGITTGRYTKVGRIVTVEVFLRWGNTTSASGGWYVNNAPFVADAVYKAFGGGTILDSGTSNALAFPRIEPSTADIRPTTITNASGWWTGVTAVSPFTWAVNDELYFNLTYITAT